MDLNRNQISEYQALHSNHEEFKYLKRTFKLPDTEKTNIILELYYYALRFARENSFGHEQTSACFSIVKETHENVTSSPLINFEKDYSFFKDLVLRHSVHRPPYSETVFSFQQMKALTDYMTHTWFI